MCRLLEVSASVYYAWCKRSPFTRAQADAKLTAQMSAIHERSRGTYGTRGHPHRTAGRWHPSGTQTVPDLVERNFMAPGSNRLWVADIHLHPD